MNARKSTASMARNTNSGGISSGMSVPMAGVIFLLTLGCIIVKQIGWCEDAFILLPPGN
jgi:hypothetical protein